MSDEQHSAGDNRRPSLSRRQTLATLGIGVVGLAGCQESGDGGQPANTTDDEPPNDGNETETDGETTDTEAPPRPSAEVRPRPEGTEIWGNELNRHAKEAGIDWQMFAGEGIDLTFLMGLHPYAVTTDPLLPYFEDLTGIPVEYEVAEVDNYWKQVRETMRNEEEYDGFMIGNWPAGEYHEQGWAADLNSFIEDETLTDRDWLAMDDFSDQTLEFMTFPDEDGGESFIGFPNGIEVYGCVGYDMETYDTLGLAEPQTFAELEANAKAISESDEVDQEGLVSRAAAATLSAANFGTMFRSHDAKWIDREVLLAEDDPDPADVALVNSDNGVEALERFAGILYNYGVPDAAVQDWYGNNVTYNNGDVGMIYSTPQTSGLIDPERIARTKWLPPLRTEDGRDRVANTWVWSTGITSHVSEQQQKAAWLFIQWINSRAANFMFSTHQWEGDDPRAGHARFEWIWDQEMYEYPNVEGNVNYEAVFKEGMDLVPTSPPPIPADTPRSMEIMSRVANAMSRTVAIGPDRAKTELDAIEQTVGEAAKEIPRRYIRSI